MWLDGRGAESRLTLINGNMMSVQLSRVMMTNTVMKAWNMSSKWKSILSGRPTCAMYNEVMITKHGDKSVEHVFKVEVHLFRPPNLRHVQ